MAEFPKRGPREERKENNLVWGRGGSGSAKAGRPNESSKNPGFQIHKGWALLRWQLNWVGSAALPSPRPTQPTGHHPTPRRTYVQQGQSPVSRAEEGHLPVGRQPCHHQARGQHQRPTVGEQMARTPQQSQGALQQPGYHHGPGHLEEPRKGQRGSILLKELTSAWTSK